MARLALLDPPLASSIAERARVEPGEVEDLRIVCSASTVEELLAAAPVVDVVVADCARLGPDPAAALSRIRDALATRTLITVYAFARRDDIERWRRAGSDVVIQGPLSVRALRTYLLSMLIEDRIRRPRPEAGPSDEAAPVTPALFNTEELARLRERSSTIQCECPNHLADLVMRLQAFESYSKDCENRNEADAQVHRTLWFATARARRILEDALVQLMKHEDIELPPRARR